MKNTQNQQTLPSTLSFDMIQVEGGSFWMGNDKSEEALDREQPAHEVKLESFYIAKYPVTQSLWKTIMGAENNPSAFKGDERPVENISREDALAFISQLNQLANQTYRLPSEAEWEYAARGGQQSRGYKYAGSDNIEEVGWYSKNSDGESKPVGLKKSNELGLFDMSGNVYEWCLDWFGDSYYQECLERGTANNPIGPATGTYRIFRGGCWNYGAERCRVAYRHHDRPWRGYPYLGFRLALTTS
ncbi:MAG: formylglycine-generating enzyme family protein [Lewinellaceae bacterium]|nr:formylglycine-generating enzyme family protein [Phaeodactylibacter sp.]MCB9040576.1 formylglycine-generating enzyme family protein [Lewinellaceae bacterium]